jgi:hypothetical protein
MTGSTFKFTKNSIDDYTEKIGVDVRPTIEIGLEQVRITEFYRTVSKKYPDLFESLLMGPTEFAIQKKLIFPGKGEATVPTFSLSNRGPVFMVPRKISALDVETDLPPIADRIVEILKDFRGGFPQCHILRVGVVHEYVFDCSPADSVQLIATRFTRVGAVSEITVVFNKPRGGFNRLFTISPMIKRLAQPGAPPTAEPTEPAGYGVKVTVDFNNADMTKPLERDGICGLLAEARDFHEKEAFDILNGEGDAE